MRRNTRLTALGTALLSAAAAVTFLMMAVGAAWPGWAMAAARAETSGGDTKIQINTPGSALAPIVAGDATPKPPVRIKRIILHQEGKPARAIELPAQRPDAVPGSTAITATGAAWDLTGNWTIAEDSRSGRVPIQDRQLRIKSARDGSFVAEFAEGADCPTGSGRRTHYINGNLSGNLLSGSIELCPSAAFISKCGGESAYTTGFQAELRDANTIEGRYTTTGYRIEAGGCVKDSNYDSNNTFLLERRETGTLAAVSEWDPSVECAPSPQIGERVVPAGMETPTDSEVSGDPVDLNAYCLATHGEGAEALLLNKQDAYSWKCIVGSPSALHPIDVEKACMMQNPFTTAELGNRCDPYSWSCTKLPVRKLVYIRLDAIEFQLPGLNEAPDLSVYFTARHASPRCSGTEYGDGNHTCGEWEYKLSEKLDPGGSLYIEITGWVYPFYLYEGSVLQIDFWAKEKDLFFDDYCGFVRGNTVIVPARRTFTESDNWGIGGKVISCRGKQTGSFRSSASLRLSRTAEYTILDIPQ